MFDVWGGNTNWNTAIVDWWAKKKKTLVDWNLKLQRKRKRQTARERKKMKLAFSSGPSLDDQSLLLEPLTFFFFFFWEERFALPHKSLSKHTNTHPQIICHHHHHHHLSAGWRTVGARNIVTVWTNSPNISDVRHRYENTHIKARVCVCVCVCNTSRRFHTHFTARPSSSSSSTFSTD